MNRQEHFQRPVFQFKKFSVSDWGCGMKIGTDGVLLGSVAASYPAHSVMDVGTGCGLIALMIAQKNPARIIALDIDPQAIEQARQNVAQSPWTGQISVLHESFQSFTGRKPRLFDLVVCNPPFFQNSLKGVCNKRNQARHAESLPADELLSGAASILAPDGNLLLIIPAEQEGQMVEKAGAFGLHANKKLWIFPTSRKPAKRVILEFSSNRETPSEDSLIIEQSGRHQYSEAYKKLTGDYYLHL